MEEEQLSVSAVWVGKGFDNYLQGVQLGVDEELRGTNVSCTLKKARWNDLDGKLELDSVKGAQILLPSIGHVSEELVGQLQNSLRLVFQPAAGFDTIDLQACRNNGIPVCNCPGANALQTAETTMMLILMSLRNIPGCVTAIEDRVVASPTGSDLTGKTVCVIGTGNVGSRVALMLQAAFNCRILPVDSKTSKKKLNQYIAEADIVSLHCPLKEDTEGLIGEAELELMKESAILINTARGKVVDKNALKNALRNDKIKFYAADVFWKEPMDPNDVMLKFKNVYFTPHIGASTEEHFRHLGRLLAGAIKQVFVDGRPDSLDNRLA